MLQEAERAENIEKQAELTAQWAIEPESILDPIYVRSSAALISKAVNFGIPVPAQRQDSEHYRRSGVTGDFIRFFPPEDLANDRSGRLTGGYAHCHELFLVARQEASQAGSARRRSDTPVRRAGHWMRDSPTRLHSIYQKNLRAAGSRFPGWSLDSRKRLSLDKRLVAWYGSIFPGTAHVRRGKIDRIPSESVRRMAIETKPH